MQRVNIINSKIEKPAKHDITRPKTFWESVVDNQIARKFFVLAVVLVIWEVAARLANTPLILPTVTDTAGALWNSLLGKNAALGGHIFETIHTLAMGFALGAFIATLLTIFAVNTRIGSDFLSTITGAFAPLPAVAVFPLALMWFGISLKSIIFIASFASVFPVAVNMVQGFNAVSDTLRRVGRNLGLSGVKFTIKILIPAALPSILSGLRSGFSNAFRALVAVEMVIGAATGSGGLGWFVMSSKQDLDIPKVFGGILSIMVIGLIFELLFQYIEKHTVRKWGMLS